MKKVIFAAALALSFALASCTDTTEITETTAIGAVQTVTEQFVQTTEPVETTAPVETTEPVETTALAETTAPVETAVPVETTVPVQTEEPEETEPFDFESANLDEYVTLGKYFGIEVYVPPIEKVTDEQIKEQLDGIVTLLPDELRATEGICKVGDTVSINYVGRVDGEEFAGSRAYDHTLTLGEGMYFDGFEEKIVGMSVGETKEIRVTVTDYLTEIDGKEAVFEVTLNYIYPALTDEVVAEYIGFETLDEFVSYIRTDLEDAANETAYAERSDAAWTKVMANSHISGYPQSAVDAEYLKQVEEYRKMAAADGITYEELLVDVYGITVAEAEEMFREIAKNNVAQTLLLYAVARDMGMDTSDSAYEEKMLELALSLGFASADELVSATGYTKVYLKERLMYDEVLYAIVQKAKFIETEFD